MNLAELGTVGVVQFSSKTTIHYSSIVSRGATAGASMSAIPHPSRTLREIVGSSSTGAVLVGAPGSGRRAAFDEALENLRAAPPVIHLIGSAYAARIKHGVLSFMLAQVKENQLGTRHELVHALAELLGSEDGRTVVTLGSPDLIDDDSAAVLAQLAAMNKICLVVACERLGQLPADILALHRSGRLALVAVPNMDVRQTRLYLEKELGGPISMFAAAALWRLTLSNRDLLHQLVRELVANEKLARQGGYWVFVQGALNVGPAMRAHASRALDGLEARQCELLGLLAYGGPVDLDCLYRVGMADTIGVLRTRGLITVSEKPKGEVRIKIPLMAHLLRDRVQEDQPENIDLMLSKLHADAQAAKVMTEVNAMLELGNFEASVAVIEEYAEHGGYTADSWAKDSLCQMSILKAEVDALIILGRNGRAGSTIARAIETISAAVVEQPDDTRLIEARQMVSIMRARMALVDGRPALVEGLFYGDAPLRTIHSSADDDDERSSSLEGSTLGRGHATLWATEALQLGAMAVQAEAWAMSTTPEKAMGIVKHIRSDIEGLRNTGVLDQVLTSADCADIEISMLRVELLAGEWWESADTARKLADGTYENPRAITFGETVLGILDGLSGGSDTALGTLWPSFQQLSVTPETVQRTVVEAAVAFCLADQERGSEALEVLSRTQTVLERTTPMNFFTWASEVFASMTVAILDTPETAALRLNVMAERARRGGSRILEMNSLAMALRMGDADAAPRLIALDSERQGPVADCYVKLARSVLTVDAAMLAEALEQLIDLGQVIFAVEPGNALLAMLGHRERRRLGAVVARFRRIEDAAPIGEAELAQAEREEPMWMRELTKREAQIARRVIAGMSNAAIARLSGVSVRTVEGHLYQVYSKLHVRNRQELADLDGADRIAVSAQ